MNWLNFLQPKTQCQTIFGRGVNADISKDEEELFNKAYEAFQKKEIFEAYEYFFKSLLNYDNETSNENVTIQKSPNKLEFVIYQGSAKIKGTITTEHLYAEITIAKKLNATVALKRYLLERNYQLTYANYFSDNECIKLKLCLDNISLSPQKIFFPLRELALNADYDREHITSEFPNTELEDASHLCKVNDKELKTKYDYLLKWIEELEEKALTLPSNDNAGMQAFLYLNFFCQIDYLLSPKNKIHYKLNKKIQAYFSNENETVEAKNEELRKYALKLKEIEFEEFKLNFYNAKYTFNQTEKTLYDEFSNFINDSLLKVRWYKNNRYSQIIPTLYKYIVFYSLYSYELNPMIKGLIRVLVEVQNASYFNDLGCDSLYDESQQEFSKRAILSKIQNVIRTNQAQFKSFSLDTDNLDFTSMNEFSNSYCVMLKNLDFEEI